MPTTITISEFQINDCNFTGTTAKLRRYYDSDWTDVDGVFHAAGAVGSSTDFFDEVNCTLSSHVLTVAAFPATPTDNALIGVPRETWQLWDQAGTARTIIFEGFIPSASSPTTFGALLLANLGQTLFENDNPTRLAQWIQGYIDIVIGTLRFATSVIAGWVRLSVAAADVSDPIAVGDNDPRVPTQGENDALAGTSGTPSSTNKYVTNADTATSGAGKVLRLDASGKLPALDGSQLTALTNEPAGSGSELQARSSATTFTPVTGSGVSGGKIGIGFNAPDFPLVIRSNSQSQIAIDFSSTKRATILTDPDGAINMVANAYFDPVGLVWHKVDVARAAGDAMVDSQGDFNYYYAKIGTENLAVPSLVRFTGVNSGVSAAPQVIISPTASTINDPNAYLFVHGTDASEPVVRIERTGTTASGETGPAVSLFANDGSGVTGGGISLNRYAGFSTTLNFAIGTTAPGGLILSGNNTTLHAQISSVGKTYLGIGGVGLVLGDTSHTPASSAEACSVGQFWWDANYLYIAVATNTFKRVALSAF